MPDCELIEKCIFFNDKMAGMPSMADVYKKNYCKGDFNSCGRYIVCKALGREKVPSSLFPNQKDKAMEIIKAG